MSAELEIRTEQTEVLNLTRGGDWLRAVELRYRPVGRLRWTKLILVPDEEQTLDELEREAKQIAELHAAAVAA